MCFILVVLGNDTVIQPDNTYMYHIPVLQHKVISIKEIVMECAIKLLKTHKRIEMPVAYTFYAFICAVTSCKYNRKHH